MGRMRNSCLSHDKQDCPTEHYIACAHYVPHRRPEKEFLRFENMSSHYTVAEAHSRANQPNDLHCSASSETKVQVNLQ